MTAIEQRQKQLLHMKATHVALDKAKQQLDAYAQKEAACQALIPKVIEALVQHGRITPEQQKQASDSLADPKARLEMLLLAADPSRIAVRRPEAIGKAEGASKQASAELPTDRFGSRRSTEWNEANRRASEKLRKSL